MLKNLCDIDVNCEGLCKRTFRAAPNSEDFVSVWIYSRVQVRVYFISFCNSGCSSVKERSSKSRNSSPLIFRSFKTVIILSIVSSPRLCKLGTFLTRTCSSAGVRGSTALKERIFLITFPHVISFTQSDDKCMCAKETSITRNIVTEKRK